MATIEPIMHLNSFSFFGQQNLMEMHDLSNFYQLNNGLNFTNGGFVLFHRFILNNFNHSNHNPEIIWRIIMNKWMHVRSIFATRLHL